MRRSAETVHQEEREEWMSQQESYARHIAESDIQIKAKIAAIEQFNAEAQKHRQEKELWETERKELMHDRYMLPPFPNFLHR